MQSLCINRFENSDGHWHLIAPAVASKLGATRNAQLIGRLVEHKLVSHNFSESGVSCKAAALDHEPQVLRSTGTMRKEAHKVSCHSERRRPHFCQNASETTCSPDIPYQLYRTKVPAIKSDWHADSLTFYSYP